MKPGNLQTNHALSDIGEHWTDKYFQIVFIYRDSNVMSTIKSGNYCLIVTNLNYIKSEIM
jgi:hypothetical protein